MKYLEAQEKYENRYDSMVIERCRNMENFWKDKPLNGSWLALFFLKMDMAEKRPDKIAKWMDQNRKRDELVEKAKPMEQYCHQCNILMDFEDKSLFFAWWKEKQDYVLLFYRCSRCKHWRWTYADGREYAIKERHCEKCHSTKVKAKINDLESGDTLYTETCSSCGHIKEDIWEKPKEKPIDPNYEADRKRFCVSHYEAMKWKSDMEEMKKMFDEIEQRNKDKKPPEEEKKPKKSYKSKKVSL